MEEVKEQKQNEETEEYPDEDVYFDDMDFDSDGLEFDFSNVSLGVPKTRFTDMSLW